MVMDIEAALAGIAERDRWKGRLEALQGELRRVQARRRRVALRLRRLGRELKRLETLANDLVRSRVAPARGGWGPGGPPGGYTPIR